MKSRWSQAASCEGKERFQNRMLAQKVLTRKKDREKTANIYRCQFCGFYHMGRNYKRKRFDK